jgi:hypothetical protein
MAQVVNVSRYCDIPGHEDCDADGQPVTFTLNGTTYEIDLCAKCRAAFTEQTQPWASHARRQAGQRHRPPRSQQPRVRSATPIAIRAWAATPDGKTALADAGLTVSNRGRIGAEVTKLYETRGS